MAYIKYKSSWKSGLIHLLEVNKLRNHKIKSVVFMVASLTFVNYSRSDVSAQIIPDNTLGAESTKIKPNVDINGSPGNLIRGGAIRGTNLFHSFERFNVGEGQGVYFANPIGVQSILSRVTGSSRSNILGKLGVLGNANLFLINPNGIIFGLNASLDLRGSFLATTASRLHLADGTQFSAITPESQPLLTISTPAGLQFEGTNGSITNLSQAISQGRPGLQVQPGKTLALVGGNIIIRGGFITVPTGQLVLGSVGIGQVVLQPAQAGWAFKYNGVRNFLDIELSSVQQKIPGFDAPLLIPSIIDASGDGGNVQVQSRNVLLQNGSQIRGTGANISLTASKKVEIVGKSPEPFPNRSGLVSATASTGNAGNIKVVTSRLIVQGGGFINAESAKEIFPDGQSTVATGNGGNLTVDASELVLLADESSSLRTSTQGPGNAGRLLITTKKLTVKDGAQISTATFGSGNASDIDIKSDQFIKLSGQESGLFAKTEGSGTGGDINIFTPLFQITDNARVDASTTDGGSGGNIFVQANAFEVSKFGKLLTTTSASGDAGDITLKVRDTVNLTGNTSGLFANTTPSSTGNAGNIFIDPKTVSIWNGATIKVNSQGIGNGGNINLQAGNLKLDRSTISAISASGTGGSIKLTIEDLLLLRNNSQISATAGEDGDGGNITINTDLLVALEDSDITANAFNGRGGNIRITTRGLFLTPDSEITASSEQGIDGVVEINNPEVDPSESLAELPETVETPQEVAQGCRPGQSPGGSKFVHIGRGGLPSNPGEVQTPSSVWQDLRTDNLRIYNSITSTTDPNPTSLDPTPPTSIVEAKGWSKDSQGRIRLTAHPSEASPGSQQPAATC